MFLSTFLPLLRPFYLSINCCLSLRALGRNLLSVTFPYPRSLLHVSLLAFLLVSKWSPYISSLHYRASFQVSSMWDFSTLPFLSLLVPLVFPSAFFTSLLITVVLSGCFWDTGLSLSPVCFSILPQSNIGGFFGWIYCLVLMILGVFKKVIKFSEREPHLRTSPKSLSEPRFW